MLGVLADLAVESEAATLTAMRIANAFDEALVAGPSSEEEAFRRSATAVAKYWICKRSPAVVYVCVVGVREPRADPRNACVEPPRCGVWRYSYEAMECHGGNGYAEEWGMARLFRQSPLNSIWEGSGNVICLDVLRAMAREPESIEALMASVRHGQRVC